MQSDSRKNPTILERAILALYRATYKTGYSENRVSTMKLLGIADYLYYFSLYLSNIKRESPIYQDTNITCFSATLSIPQSSLFLAHLYHDLGPSPVPGHSSLARHR